MLIIDHPRETPFVNPYLQHTYYQICVFLYVQIIVLAIASLYLILYLLLHILTSLIFLILLVSLANDGLNGMLSMV